MFLRNCLLKHIMTENVEGMIEMKEGKEEAS